MNKSDSNDVAFTSTPDVTKGVQERLRLQDLLSQIGFEVSFSPRMTAEQSVKYAEYLALEQKKFVASQATDDQSGAEVFSEKMVGKRRLGTIRRLSKAQPDTRAAWDFFADPVFDDLQQVVDEDGNKHYEVRPLTDNQKTWQATKHDTFDSAHQPDDGSERETLRGFRIPYYRFFNKDSGQWEIYTVTAKSGKVYKVMQIFISEELPSRAFRLAQDVIDESKIAEEWTQFNSVRDLVWKYQRLLNERSPEVRTMLNGKKHVFYVPFKVDFDGEICDIYLFSPIVGEDLTDEVVKKNAQNVAAARDPDFRGKLRKK